MHHVLDVTDIAMHTNCVSQLANDDVNGDDDVDVNGDVMLCTMS